MKSHGKTKTTEYHIWRGIIARCCNSRHDAYPRYGGRGITLCPRWRSSFESFLADVGVRPSPQHTIDRIDNNGNYEPGNVRWATKTEQARNKRQNINVTIDGVTQCLTAWLEHSTVNPHTIWARIRDGWPAQDALFVPAGARKRTKLKPEQIPIIRELLGRGISPYRIGPQFGVSHTTIQGIAYGLTWRDK